MKRATLVLLLVAGCSRPAPLDGEAGVDAGVSLTALPLDRWTYVPVPGAVCGNGSPAAIGVNPHAGATRLLVVMEGGGACWDARTCFVDERAVHVHEDYAPSLLDASLVTVTGAGLDDRHAAGNVFRDANIVFVPYCTGDLHGGDAVQSYDGRTVHHAGGRNMALFLGAMRDAWPGITETFVLGFSAGGYGAQIQWGHYAEAWPSATLALFADCSPLVTPTGSLWSTWRTAWNLETPAGCTECSTTFAAYDDFHAAAHPSSRFGLLAANRDAVIADFFAIGDMPAALDALETEHLDHDPNVRYFVIDSDEHVILDDVPQPTAVDGTALGPWIAAFLTNDTARWTSTR